MMSSFAAISPRFRWGTGVLLLHCIIAGATPAAAQCGTAWQPVQGIPGTSNSVRAMTTLPNGDLVAGGTFSTAGGVVANRIARWDGTA